MLPLAYLRDGERYVIFGSKAGAPTHPAWYHNVKAHPDVKIEVGTQTLDVHASEVTGPERDRLFEAQAQRVPQFAGYVGISPSPSTVPPAALNCSIIWELYSFIAIALPRWTAGWHAISMC